MRTLEMFRTFRRLPPALWILAGGTFVNRFATLLIVFLTLFLDSRGYSPVEGGFAVMMYSVGGLFSGFVAGPLGERFARNRVMGFALIFEACCVLSMGFADTFEQICAVSFAAGFASMLSHPATSALVNDIVEVHHRTAAQLLLRLAINSGWAFGPMAAGLIITSSKHGYMTLFACDAASSVIFGILCLTCLPRGSSHGQGGGQWMPAIRMAATMKPFLAVLLANALMAFVFRQLVTTFPLQMKDAGHDEGFIGVVQGLNGVLIILVEIPLMAATVALGLRRGIALSGVIFGLSMLILLLGGSWMVFVAAMLVLTVGEMICFPRHAVYIANLSPPEVRSRFAGMNGLAWLLGNLVGSLLGTVIFQSSPAALWWLCGAIGMLSAVVMYIGGPAPEAEAMARQTAPETNPEPEHAAA